MVESKGPPLVYATRSLEPRLAVFGTRTSLKQPLTFFSRLQQPIALAVLLDTSASMEGKLGTAQEAAVGFARRLRKTDVMEVIEFDSQVNIVQEFTSDIALLEKAIQSTTVSGSTSTPTAGCAPTPHPSSSPFARARHDGPHASTPSCRSPHP